MSGAARRLLSNLAIGSPIAAYAAAPGIARNRQQENGERDHRHRLMLTFSPQPAARCEEQKKHILIYRPTNNCGRIALFVKLNGLEGEIDLKKPGDYGGLKSPEYLAINPQARYPAFISKDGDFKLFESQVILDYLQKKYQSRVTVPKESPSPEHHAKVRLLIQVHDMYIASANCTQPGYFATQGCLYKGDEMSLQDRSARAQELKKQMQVLASLAGDEGPYLCGKELTLADLVIYPTFIFILEIAPESLGWPETAYVPDRLKEWFYFLDKQPVFKEIGADIRGFLKEIFVDTGKYKKIRAVVESAEGKKLQW